MENPTDTERDPQSSSSRADACLNLRATDAWKGWVKRLTAHTKHPTPSDLFDSALRAYAKSAGLRDGPIRTSREVRSIGGVGRTKGKPKSDSGSPQNAFVIRCSQEWKDWAGELARAAWTDGVARLIEKTTGEYAKSAGFPEVPPDRLV